MAIQLACQVFLPYLTGRVVQILTDNRAAMFYIDRQCGACSSALCHEDLHLWNFTVQNYFHIMASHLPGTRNALENLLSKSFLSHPKWSLHPEIAGVIFQKWRTAQVDFFAFAQNKKCCQFCSIRGHDKDSLSNAFLLLWTGHSCTPSHQYP